MDHGKVCEKIWILPGMNGHPLQNRYGTPVQLPRVRHRYVAAYILREVQGLCDNRLYPSPFCIVRLLKEAGAFIDSAVHARSDGVRLAAHHQIGSNRNYRILKGTCRLPGG